MCKVGRSRLNQGRKLCNPSKKNPFLLCAVSGIVETRLNQTVTASDGNTYDIEVVYKNTSGIPMEGTTLAVSELLPGDAKYDEYVAASAAKVGTKAENIELSRVFDIRIVDENDQSIIYEPTGDVEVSIRLVGEALNDYANIDVLHFVEDENTDGFTVYDLDSTVDGESVQFITDSFSVYVVAGYVLEKTIEAGDGNTYLITVEYDDHAGIPGDAELEVSEILEGSSEFASYLTTTAEQAGFAEREVSLARAFDISIVDTETGEHYQPNSAVTVTIQVMENLESEDEFVSVVHFGDSIELMNSTVGGDSVTFETDSFSVYVVASAPAPFGADKTPETDVSKLDGKAFFISAKTKNANKSQYYMTGELVNNGTEIRRSAANDVTDAKIFYFKLVAETTNQFTIYFYDDAGNEKYIRRNGSNLAFTGDFNEATKFTVEYGDWNSYYGFRIHEGSAYINLIQQDAGRGFNMGGLSDNGQYMILTPAFAMESDPYGLDGQSYGIVYVDGNTGVAMTSTAYDTASFKGENVTVGTEGADITITKTNGDITL